MAWMFNLILISLFLIGCSNTPNVRRLDYKQNQSELLLQSVCLQKYQVALNECKDFVSHEKNLSKRDQHLIKCLKNKNFPDGSKNCS
jgi:uncharacterized protein YcfL